jgi:hypothetical protein
MVNRSKEVLIPVYLFDEGDENKDEVVWLPISKTVAKGILDEAEEREIEEVCGVTEEDGCLYLDGPSDEEGEEEEEEEEAPEGEVIDTTGEAVE